MPLEGFYTDFNDRLGETVQDEDWEEILRQIFHELMNHPPAKVIQNVGASFPHLDRLCDTRFLYEPAYANRLTIATAHLVAAVIFWCTSAKLFGLDGTLAYIPKRFCVGVVVLEYLPLY